MIYVFGFIFGFILAAIAAFAYPSLRQPIYETPVNDYQERGRYR